MAQRERGIVLDIESDRILVATAACEFVTLPARRPQPRLGEEIEFVRATPFRSLPAFAAALILIALAVGWAVSAAPHPFDQAVYFVALDINPSCELGVNIQDTVVSVESNGLDNNPICRPSFQGIGIQEALRAAFVGAANGGYLKEGEPNYVSITFVTGQGVTNEFLPGTDETHDMIYRQLVILGLDDTTVALFQTDYDTRVAAHEAGLTVNRYMARSRLTEWGLEAKDVEQMTTRELIMALKSIPWGENYRLGEREPERDEEDIVVPPEVPATDPEGSGEGGNPPDPGDGTPSGTEEPATETGAQTDTGTTDSSSTVNHVVWRTTGEIWPNLPADWTRSELRGLETSDWKLEVSCEPTAIKHKAWVYVTIKAEVPEDIDPAEVLVYLVVDMPSSLDKASDYVQLDPDGTAVFRFFVNPADCEGRYVARAFVGTSREPQVRDSCTFEVVR